MYNPNYNVQSGPILLESRHVMKIPQYLTIHRWYRQREKSLPALNLLLCTKCTLPKTDFRSFAPSLLQDGKILLQKVLCFRLNHLSLQRSFCSKWYCANSTVCSPYEPKFSFHCKEGWIIGYQQQWESLATLFSDFFTLVNILSS